MDETSRNLVAAADTARGGVRQAFPPPCGQVVTGPAAGWKPMPIIPRFPSGHPPMLLPERVVRVLALSIAIVMAAFVLFGAQQAGQANPVPGPYFDKLVHAAYYGVMAILVDRGLGGRLPIIAMVAAIVVGAADEIHQLDVPGREASVFDWAADVVGAVVFTLLWRAARRAGRRRT